MPLAKTQKHLDEVSGDIAQVTKRSEKIQQRLRDVEELPGAEPEPAAVIDEPMPPEAD